MRTTTPALLVNLILGFLFSLVGARAATVSLPVAADTFILSSAPDNNAGGNTLLNIGTDGQGGVRRGLLRFDPGTIPAGATITSAVLRLTVVRIPFGGPMNSRFDLHRLLADWTVGVQAGNSGAPATEGEVTWNSRMHGTGVWTEPGAAGDIETAPSASVFVDSVGGVTYTWSGAGGIRDVQDWLSEPESNFGWLLRSNNEGTHRTARAFAASEYGHSFGTLEIGFTPRSNKPPTIFITTPTNGATVTNGSFAIHATATDSDGGVIDVRFFDGTNLLGNDITAPYSISVSLTNGIHTLTALATDNEGAFSISTPIVILHAPPPPVLTLTRSRQSIVIQWDGPYSLESALMFDNSAPGVWTPVHGLSPVTLQRDSVSNRYFRATFP